MPVTKTAKRALRGSKRKEDVNKLLKSKLEAAIRTAEKGGTKEKIKKAISLADRAAKKHVIHRNKAARIKSMLAKLSPLRARPPVQRTSGFGEGPKGPAAKKAPKKSSKKK